MESILNAIADNSGATVLVIVCLSTLIEITPIKINPITSLLKWFGDRMNKNTSAEIKNVLTKLDDFEVRIDRIEVNNMRTAILNFGDSLRTDPDKSKEEFEHIIDLHSEYEEIIKSRGMTNGRIDLTYKFISEVYDKKFNTTPKDI